MTLLAGLEIFNSFIILYLCSIKVNIYGSDCI